MDDELLTKDVLREFFSKNITEYDAFEDWLFDSVHRYKTIELVGELYKLKD